MSADGGGWDAYKALLLRHCRHGAANTRGSDQSQASLHQNSNDSAQVQPHGPVEACWVVGMHWAGLIRSLTYNKDDRELQALGCVDGTESDGIGLALGGQVVGAEQGCIIDKGLQRVHALQTPLWLRRIHHYLLILPGFQTICPLELFDKRLQ